VAAGREPSGVDLKRGRTGPLPSTSRGRPVRHQQ